MYFVTTVKVEDKKVIRTRMTGFLRHKVILEEVLNNNCYDLHEAGYYNYAVMEDISEGFYNFDESPIWFKWDPEKKGFYRCEKPDIDDDYTIFAF